MSSKIFAGATALLACMSLQVGTAAQAPLAGLNAYVHRAMSLWNVPGLAVAVVHDGHVVLARGYGVRALGKPGRVDANTLFTIGSNSKAFTVAALGTLVAAGKLRWNDHVVDYVPHFRLRSAYVTQHVTLRDLLSHRTGYCDPTFMWYPARDTAANIIHRLRYQRPTYGFRAHFCYNNTMYLVASRFIPAVTGMSWQRYVRAHLFEPLDMTRTDATEAAVAAVADAALPNGWVNGKAQRIHRYWAHNMDVFAPVGGINSSVNDLSHWLLMLLADGRYDGKTVVPRSVIEAMETPQAIIQKNSELAKWLMTQTPHGHFYAYGLGFILQEYAGHKLVWHAGDIDGMASALALVPGKHLGVVALSNMNESRASEGVVFYVLQSYLGLAHHDVSAALYAQRQKAKRAQRAQEKRLAATRVPGAKAPLPLSDYAGKYTDKFYGTVHVSEAHGHLVLRMGNPMFTGDLQPWHGETFHVVWRYGFYNTYGIGYVTFAVDALGRPDRVSFTGTPNHYERSAPRSQSPGSGK